MVKGRGELGKGLLDPVTRFWKQVAVKQEKKHKWRTLNGENWYKGTKISYTTNNNTTSLHTPLAYGKKRKLIFFLFFFFKFYPRKS